MTKFPLPPVIKELVNARSQLRDHYQAILAERGSDARLSFTFDGNLVGDLGEALAVYWFGIRLVKANSVEGFDGYTPDGKTVQVKATGTKRGPAFRPTKTRAEHLIFFELDLDAGMGEVVFNGPERYAFDKLPKIFMNQRSLTAIQIREADKLVLDHERLPFVEEGACSL